MPSGEEGTPLGVVAGAGPLPLLLLEAAKRRGRKPVIIAFEGTSDHRVANYGPVLWARLGAAGAMLDFLKVQAVKEVVFLGPVNRPSLADLRPDWRAAKFVAAIGRKAFAGDDSLLSSIAGELEKEGLSLVGPDAFLESLLMRSGRCSDASPSPEALEDIAKARAILKSLGPFDIGQGLVIQNSRVLAIEAAEGTDAMIRRAADLRAAGEGPLLVKGCKPQQDRRIDLPTIGLRTVELAIEAGFSGIAVEAGATLFGQEEDAIARANRSRLFIFGYEGGS